MSKVEKILSKWKSKPTEVDWEEIKSMLIRYGMDIDQKSGSHAVISHPSLCGKSKYGQLGEFCIPLKNGRHVKGFYLARILEAIEIIKEGQNE
ncbi:MAG: hypothetical protein GX556_06525 [Fibrobacter sp.]|nr:hypothetical protein [Fibrobacter sp.]